MKEHTRAERWVTRHSLGSMPGHRLENGETGSSDRLHASHSAGSYSADSDIQHWEEMMQDGGLMYEPMVGNIPGVRPKQLLGHEHERRARIEHVFTFLLPEHLALLRMRHLERMTLEAIGAELKCSHVNVIKRLKVAEQDFRKAYGQHYDDDLSAA